MITEREALLATAVSTMAAHPDARGADLAHLISVQAGVTMDVAEGLVLELEQAQ